MFIVKDLRKIPEILADAVASAKSLEPSSGPDDCRQTEGAGDRNPKRQKREILTELRLSGRQAEFNGSLSILCNPPNALALRNLTSLSLYNCGIKSLDGIGMLASPVSDVSSTCCCPDLRDLNVGRNPLTTLPDELALLCDSLTELWCDDCSIDGPIPDCVMRLKKLEILRISNNSISHIPDEVGELLELQVLCLDGNNIETVPLQLAKLKNLKSLMLRQNDITRLPEGVPGQDMAALSLLHVSSNKLEFLPRSLAECCSLKQIYANGNALRELPPGLGKSLRKLKTFNASSNDIESLSLDFVERFGEPDTKTGKCSKDSSCAVDMDQNPIVTKIRAELKSQQDDLGNTSVAVAVCVT